MVSAERESAGENRLFENPVLSLCLFLLAIYDGLAVANLTRKIFFLKKNGVF